MHCSRSPPRRRSTANGTRSNNRAPARLKSITLKSWSTTNAGSGNTSKTLAIKSVLGAGKSERLGLITFWCEPGGRFLRKQCGVSLRRPSAPISQTENTTGDDNPAAFSFTLRLLPRFRLQERPLAQLPERLLELLLRIHHDRPVPRHGLLQRLT